jgi:hypothetical protein
MQDEVCGDDRKRLPPPTPTPARALPPHAAGRVVSQLEAVRGMSAMLTKALLPVDDGRVLLRCLVTLLGLLGFALHLLGLLRRRPHNTRRPSSSLH